MDKKCARIEIPGMARKKLVAPKLYVGPWIRRLGRKNKEVAEAAGIGESYMSQIANGEKANPGPGILKAIADDLGLTVDDLYREPPPADVVEVVEKLNPSEIAVLGQILSRFNKKKPTK